MELIIDEKDFPKCSVHQESLVAYGCLNTACYSRLLCSKCIQNHPHTANIQYYEFLCEFIKKNKVQAQQNQNNFPIKVGIPFKQYLDQQFLIKFTQQIDNQVKILSIAYERINQFIGNYMQKQIGQLETYKSQLQIRYKEFIEEYQKNIQSAKSIQYFTPNVLNTKLIQQGSQANNFLRQIGESGAQNTNTLYQFDAFIKQAPEVSKQIKIFGEQFNKFINNQDNITGTQPIKLGAENDDIIKFDEFEDNIQEKNIINYPINAQYNQIQVIQNIQSSTQEIIVQGLDIEKNKNYELEFKQLNKFKDWVVSSILLLSSNLLVFLQINQPILSLFDFTNKKIIQQVNLNMKNTWLVQLTNEFFISGGENNQISLLKYFDNKIQFQYCLELGESQIVQALNLGKKTFVVVNALGTIIYYNLNNYLKLTSQIELKDPKKKKTKIRLTLIEEFFKFGVYLSGESNSFIFQIDEVRGQIQTVNKMYKAPTIIWRNPQKCCLLSTSGFMIAKNESSELEDGEVDTIMITSNKTTYVVTLPIVQGICKKFIVNENDEVLVMDQSDICENKPLSLFYYPRIQVFKGNSGNINVFIANPENQQGYLTLFEINFK